MSANCSSVPIIFTSKVLSFTACLKWWYLTAICLVRGLFLGTLANFSAPFLSSKSVYLICIFASGISKIDFISRIHSHKSRTSLTTVDNDMYSASIVDKAISVWKWLNHVIGNPAYFITHPILNLTELGSSQVSFCIVT